MSSIYRVQDGDTLSAIASRYDTSLTKLLKLNPEISNPDRIFSGQMLQVPAANDEFTSCSVSRSVIQEPPCSEVIVDIVHVTGSDQLILLTEEELNDWIEEERFVCTPIEEFYEQLDSLSDGDKETANQPLDSEGQILSDVQKKKEQLVEALVEKEIIDPGMQTITRLTEIKRLGGNKHYTYVRSDKIKNHRRSYSINARDRDRNKGWLTREGVDPEKLRKAIRSELNIKVNLWNGTLDEDHPVMLTLNQLSDEVSGSVWGDKQTRRERHNETGFDASAEAQFMRFAAGSSGSAEFNPRNGKVHVQAKAEAQFALAQGTVSFEQSYPVNNRSEIRIYYRIGGWDGERAHVSLGYFQARLKAGLSGFAGASVLLAGNIHVDSTQGLPTIKGIAGGNRNQGINAKAEAFVGVRAGCQITGSLIWVDLLSQQSDWKTLCKIGKKVEGAAGIGVDFELKLGFSRTTGKFFINLHAGLVIGVGASGSFLLEVEPENILEMIHFIYKALGDVDYRYLELFDSKTKAFDWYQKIAVYALGAGISYTAAAIQIVDFGVDTILEFHNQFIRSFQNGLQQEETGYRIALNLIKDLDKGEKSVLLHSPPEVKGPVLGLLSYDFWATPQLLDGTHTKVRAVKLLLRSFQSWRDFKESIVRMNPHGEPRHNDFDSNVECVFRFIGKNLHDYRLFRSILINKSAKLVGPVRLDPHTACRACNIS